MMNRFVYVILVFLSICFGIGYFAANLFIPALHEMLLTLSINSTFVWFLVNVIFGYGSGIFMAYLGVTLSHWVCFGQKL